MKKKMKMKKARRYVKVDERYINQFILFLEHKENGEIKYFDVDNDFDTYYGDVRDLILDY